MWTMLAIGQAIPKDWWGRRWRSGGAAHEVAVICGEEEGAGGGVGGVGGGDAEEGGGEERGDVGVVHYVVGAEAVGFVDVD